MPAQVSKKICILIVYFGNWPSYWPIFFESLRKNSSFDFLIIGDKIPQAEYARNILIKKETFEDFKAMLGSVIGENIDFPNPYKLCDFKPMYGHVFEEFLKPYAFWGYADNDLVFGDLSAFLTNEILDAHQKVFSRGNLTLYQNTDEMKYLYRNVIAGCDWRKVIHSPFSMTFDEWPGVHKIATALNIPTYLEEVICDVDYMHHDMRRTRGDVIFPQTMFLRDGKIFHHLHGRTPIELAYIHLQKRPMRYDISLSTNGDYIYFGPDRIFSRPSLASSRKEMEDINSSSFIDIIKWRVKLIRRRAKNATIKIEKWKFERKTREIA